MPTPSSAPGRRMRREAGEERLEVAARLALPLLRRGRDRHDEIGGLEPDRVVARAGQQALDDPPELEDGSLDPDELTGEPAWWDEGSDDED